jgi:hypothetical protein
MPRARTSDPSTSHEAAASVQRVSKTQAAILFILQYPMSDERLIDSYYSMSGAGMAPNAAPSGIRSRRKELVDLGLVADTGERERLASGRHAILWQTVEQPLDVWPKRIHGEWIWACCVSAIDQPCRHTEVA